MSNLIDNKNLFKKLLQKSKYLFINKNLFNYLNGNFFLKNNYKNKRKTCIITKRSRGVVSKLRLSRIVIRDFFKFSVSGLQKSSW